MRTLNFSRIKGGASEDLAEIAAELAVAGMTTSMPAPLVVGARCRDLLHAALGYTDSTRSTHDVDIAVAVEDWQLHETLARAFEPVGDTGLCFRVAGMPVDVIPYGSLEAPPGSIDRRRGAGVFDVWGFEQAASTSSSLVTMSGVELRVPSLAGYSLLKLRAWTDRSAQGIEQDAPDVALILRWAVDAPMPQSPSDDYIAWFELYGSDVTLVHARCWGAMIRAEFGDKMSDDLADALMSSDLEQLAREAQRSLRLPSTSGASSRAQARSLINALIAGLRP